MDVPRLSGKLCVVYHYNVSNVNGIQSVSAFCKGIGVIVMLIQKVPNKIIITIT